MKILVRTGRLTTRIVWGLSWFALYLEIFRWHHVGASLGLNVPLPTTPEGMWPRPGGFVLTVLWSSAAAPVVYGLFVAWSRRTIQRPDPRQGESISGLVPIGLVWLTVGLAISFLGAINHLLTDPGRSIIWDLTMTRGDGGFVVDGLFLAGFGLIWSRSFSRAGKT